MFDDKRRAQTASNERLRADHNSPSWLVFPTHERLLASQDVTLLECLEGSRQRLKEISSNGTVEERTRARVAQRAYELTSDLLETILETRRKMTLR
jgi:hypothetical protein